jgi:hypothetical protein
MPRQRPDSSNECRVMSETLVGLDVGTTAARAVLFDLSGAERAVAGEAYWLRTPFPGWGWSRGPIGPKSRMWPALKR